MEIILSKSIGFENGEEKFKEQTFVAPSPKARVVRKAVEMSENINFSDLKTSDLDNMVNYIVELFGKQFTIEDVYDGLDAEKLMPTLMDCINSVVGTMGAKLNQFPNGQTGK